MFYARERHPLHLQRPAEGLISGSATSPQERGRLAACRDLEGSGGVRGSSASFSALRRPCCVPAARSLASAADAIFRCALASSAPMFFSVASLSTRLPGSYHAMACRDSRGACASAYGQNSWGPRTRLLGDSRYGPLRTSSAAEEHRQNSAPIAVSDQLSRHPRTCTGIMLRNCARDDGMPPDPFPLRPRSILLGRSAWFAFS